MSALLCLIAGLCVLPVLHGLNVAGGFAIARGLRTRMVSQSRGVLVLTYDDGVSERLEPRLVSLLEEFGTRATFFLLGARTEGRAHRVRDLESAGHEIGSHSFAHLDAFKTDPFAVARDLRAGWRILDQVGVRSRLYRPPYGRMTLTMVLALRRIGARIAMWTHDSGDTAGVLPSIEDVVESIRRTQGGVVLFHSHDRGVDAAEREDFVIALTRRLLETAAAEGLEVATVSGLFERGTR